MWHSSRIVVALGIALTLAGCSGQPAVDQGEASSSGTTSTASATPAAAAEPGGQKTYTKIMGPAVVGMFYPRHEEEITKLIDPYLADAKPEPVKNLRGLVCPHAGYAYSGKTAAFGYKLLEGSTFKTVIVMGPTHHAIFRGGALPDADAFETPLGIIPISSKTAELAKRKPFAVNPEADVHRPEWWRLSPQRLPPFGKDTPHTWEHSVEVQLPFLQRVLKEFSVVPIVFGEVDPQAAAKAVAEVLDDQTLLVASSDLSHYHPYDEAKKLDSMSVRAVADVNLDWAEQINKEWPGDCKPCGIMPILTLMHVAKLKGWKAKLLDYRNSGDTAGDKSHVVGYAAIAFYQPDGPAAKEEAADLSAPTHFSAAQRKVLLELARRTVTAVVKGEPAPPVSPPGIDQALTQTRACFVTLTKAGQLRGCIGSILPQEPLYEAVIRRAQSAALEDPRFSAVVPDELDKLQIEVSVLTRPKRLEFNSPDDLLKKLRPKVDGVVLRVGGHSATYLPQVWEQLPDKEQFLGQLSEKAGLSSSAWRSPDASVQTYQVEAFKEKE